MLSTMGERIARVFRATAPDPFVLAILLSAVAFALSWLATDFTLQQTLDAWAGGLWGLLAFAMQMSLILVTGYALASSKPVRRVVGALAGVPRSGGQAAAMVSLVAMSCGLVNWGFGLIVGAILARDVARSLASRGIAAPGALLAASGYTSMLTWHGGLSGSAPLKAAAERDMIETLGPELAARVGAIPVSQTLLSPLNLVATGGLLVLIPLLMGALCPKGGPATGAPAPSPEPAREETPGPARTIPERLERSPVVAWLLAAPMLVWLAQRFGLEGFDALTLNSAILLFLALGLALHASPGGYARAVEEASASCAGIIVQFPLYGGIMGMVSASGLAARISAWFAGLGGGSEGALSVSTFLSAGLVNLFVPSGGGQWAIQGPIAMGAALDAGADPARLVMAVAYGDQWTNMLQPFWALPLLALTGQRAQEVVGYTAVALAAGGAWMMCCLLVF